MKRPYIATLIATSVLALSCSLASAQTLVQPSADKQILTVSGDLILIRDARASIGGGGGYDKGSCWKGCFERYNNCVDQTAKSVCVPQMKSCMAVCDTISGGS